MTYMVSVIIPMYNEEKNLTRTIEKIQAQSFKDFEVLLIDDGSSDKTGKIAKKVCQEDLRFKYYYQSNQGVSAARNLGLEKSSGEYISFLDADDEWDRNFLKLMINQIFKKNADVCFVDININILLI